MRRDRARRVAAGHSRRHEAAPVRDPKVWRMASVPLQLTTKTYTVNHVIHQEVTARALSSSTPAILCLSRRSAI